jgi:hypothetical protein
MRCDDLRLFQEWALRRTKNDARGIAEMTCTGRYRPVHVKSPAAQSMRTTLTARMHPVTRPDKLTVPAKALLGHDL